MGHKAESACVELYIKPVNLKDKQASNMSTLKLLASRIS